MPDDIKMTDLTGSDPEFKRGDRRYMVFQSTQTIDFGEPAFANTIKVYRIDDGTPDQRSQILSSASREPSSLGR